MYRNDKDAEQARFIYFFFNVLMLRRLELLNWAKNRLFFLFPASQLRRGRPCPPPGPCRGRPPPAGPARGGIGGSIRMHYHEK